MYILSLSLSVTLSAARIYMYIYDCLYIYVATTTTLVVKARFHTSLLYNFSQVRRFSRGCLMTWVKISFSLPHNWSLDKNTPSQVTCGSPERLRVRGSR